MIKIILIVLEIIIVLMALVIVMGDISFNREVKSEVKKLFKNYKERKSEIISEDDIKVLPEPVQKFLRYTKIIGKEKIRTVRLKQGGYFRLKENQKWMPIKAEQYYDADSVEFIWTGKINFIPLFSIRAKDKFIDGRGNLIVKLLGLIKIIDAKGPEIDQGEILRFLGECVWFPSAFLNDYIKWEAIDSNSAKATINCKGISASAIFYFNKKGEIVKIKAKRYREENGKFMLDDWEIPIIEYKMFNGIVVPSKVNVIWKLSTGDFCYDKVEIIDIEYNNPSVY